MDATRKLDEQTLAEIVRRIVEVARPEKIILFGSAARGERGPDSDVDVLVVKSGDIHRGRLAGRIHRHLHGVDAAVDVIVVKPEDIERYGDSPYTVLCPALKEGKMVYVA
jgi:predicted nucleotidyltransferase